MRIRSLRLTLALGLVLGIAAPSAQAGAQLVFDAETKTMTIRAHLVYFTNARKIPDHEAAAITEEISRQWSGLPTRPGDAQEIRLWVPGPVSYDLRIELTYEAGLTLDEARAKALKTKDPSVIFVRIAEGGTPAERRARSHLSRTTELTGNTIILYDDDLGNYTTAAHEFGHALGLDHRAQPVAGLPSIMYPRGAFVEPQYRYDPSDPRSTLNPIWRRVTFFDIRDFDFVRYAPAGGSGTVTYGVAYANVYRGPGREYYKAVFSRANRP